MSSRSPGLGPAPRFTLASASGNRFAYLWEDEAGPGFDGAAWARRLCPPGAGLGLDGLFLLHRPGKGPWILDHWEPTGDLTFCSNGSRAAMGLAGAPEAAEALSSGVAIRLRSHDGQVGIRMPSGPDFGLLESPLGAGSARGWIGNPQLIVEVEDVASLDLPTLAPPLRHHPALPDGANVSFVQVLGPGRARIRTWERGVEGETLCCGTGCATAGAWLALRTGIPRWAFEPAGPDPVAVEARMEPDGRWRELWLEGPVRILGTFAPGPGLGVQVERNADVPRGTW